MVSVVSQVKSSVSNTEGPLFTSARSMVFGSYGVIPHTIISRHAALYEADGVVSSPAVIRYHSFVLFIYLFNFFPS